MGTFYAQNDYRNYLAHFGVKGMKWGVRRYQSANGSYTSAGRKRYGVGDGQPYKAVKGGGARNTAEAKAARRAKLKKAAMVVGGAAALAGAGYLGAKYGRGALQAYRSGGWNVEGVGTNHGGGMRWRDRGRAAKFRTVNTGLKVPGRGDAMRRAASNAAGSIRNAVSGAAGKARGAASDAATNVRGRFNKNPKLPSTALKVPGRGDAMRRAASNAAKGVRNAASNAAFNARSARVAAGNAARDAATNVRGRFNKNPKLPSTALKVPGRGDAMRRAASNAAKGVRNAGAYARDAGNKARAGLERIGNTRVSPNVARAVNVGSAVVGGAAGIAAGRAARKAYEKRYGGNNGRSNSRKRRR